MAEEEVGPEHPCAWQAGREILTAMQGHFWSCWECCDYYHCCLSPAYRQKLHEADLELQRKREYIEELEPPTDGSSELGLAAGWVWGALSSGWS